MLNFKNTKPRKPLERSLKSVKETVHTLLKLSYKLTVYQLSLRQRKLGASEG